MSDNADEPTYVTSDESLREIIVGLGPLPVSLPNYSWERHRYELRKHILEQDLTDFFNWSTVQATMFVGENRWTRNELAYLQEHPMFPRYRIALQENDFCSPVRMSEAQYTSGNLVRQVSHLEVYERGTGFRIEDAGTILEFGGGYGALCAIARRLGFVGDYWIVAFPEL